MPIVLMWICAMFLSVAPSMTAHAADISIVQDKLCRLSLRGAIVVGDAVELTKRLGQIRIDPNDKRTFSICLQSDGGSFSEGLEIAEIIYRKGLATVVPYDSDCFSACALAFMAGVGPAKLQPLRHLSVGARLGFHAPYLQVPDKAYSKGEIEAASQGMRSAILALSRISSQQTKLASTEFLKKSLIHRILESGPSELFFVRTVAEAARWNIDLYDADTYLPQPSSVEGIKNACRNFHYSNMDEDIPERASYSLRIEKYSSRFQKNDARIIVDDQKTSSTICEIYPRNMSGDPKVLLFGCSFDYWSSRSFGDCRNYKSDPAILIGKFLPEYFEYDPSTTLLKFTR